MRVAVVRGERGISRDRLEETYLRCATSSTRFAYFLCGDPELAEDLVQEAFIRIAGRPVLAREVQDIDAYLRRIVVNLYTSSLRRRRIERAALAQRAPAVGGTGPDELAERDAMWQALHHLPRRQRAAIVLRFYEDLSEQAAADALGCSKGALNSLTVRAVRTLRTVLIRGEDE
jgi:RNA polymerase sigma-70 factor (sigma-E family)